MNVRRVMLVIPPGAPGTTPNREGASGLGATEPIVGGFRYPPHTVAMLTATLRRAGFEVQAHDAVALEQDVDRCVNDIRHAEIDLVGVFVSWATRQADGAFLAALRERLRIVVPVVAFGISVPLLLDQLTAADYLLQGEPELTFPALCSTLREGASPHSVVNSQALRVDGYGEQGLIQDLDALPFPDWNSLAVGAYTHLTVLSSRGCDAACQWCPYVLAQGRRFRACSPERTVEELREVVKRYHSQRIIFRDPVFARDPERVREICRLVIDDPLLRPGRALRWECESRPEHLSGLVRLMSLAGCTGVKIGLETTDPRLLWALGRTASEDEAADYLDHVTSVVRACSRWGVASRLFVMAGLPGQTVETAQETAQFLTELRPDTLTIKPFKAYPGLSLVDGETGEIVSRSGDVADQLRILESAQRAIQGTPPRRSSRFTRRLARFAHRVSSAFRRS